MATTSTFSCKVISPEKAILECDATFAAFPAHDGEMGILRDRAPLVCKLGIGVLRIESPEKTYTLFIDGGFAQVIENKITFLTEQARFADSIDATAADQAMIEAQAMKITDDATFTARDKAMQRAQVQIKLSRSR
ncbi:MAG: ATP synthase F1 subunit epsilon [Planctomycetota bacterium]